MRTPGFSVDQLMELAGLSVACAVKQAALLTSASRTTSEGAVPVVAGPRSVPGRHMHDGSSLDFIYIALAHPLSGRGGRALKGAAR